MNFSTVNQAQLDEVMQNQALSQGDAAMHSASQESIGRVREPARFYGSVGQHYLPPSPQGSDRMSQGSGSPQRWGRMSLPASPQGSDRMSQGSISPHGSGRMSQTAFLQGYGSMSQGSGSPHRGDRSSQSTLSHDPRGLSTGLVSPHSASQGGSRGSARTAAERKSEVEYKGKQKDKKTVKFIEDSADRARRFDRKGKTIIENAKELSVQTGAKVAIRMEYTTTRGTMKMLNFPTLEKTVPASTRDPDQGASGGAGSRTPIRVAVKEGFKDAFSELNLEVRNRGRSSDSDSSDSDESADSQATSAISVPSTRRSANPRACFICKSSSNMVPERFQAIDSEFLRCALQGCPGQVHCDCIGMPQLGPNDELNGKWYCNLHIGVGRSQVVRISREAAPVEGPVPSTSGFALPGTQGRGQAKRGRPPTRGRLAAATRAAELNLQQAHTDSPVPTQGRRTQGRGTRRGSRGGN